MKRQAYLIGGNYQKPGSFLPGIRADIAAWKQYLMSSYGGCWNEDEIIDLSGESKEHIHSALQAGRAVNYSLVCFSGHGYLAKDRFGFNVTMTLIDDAAEMSERELNPGSPWTMMIFDCCRRSLDQEKVACSNEARNTIPHINTRVLFENEMLKCERGLVKVFAASEGEAADDDRSFSRVLIEVAKSKVGTHGYGVLNISDAVSFAKAEMAMVSKQKPVYLGGRRLHHFPFAVAPKPVNS